MKALPEKLVMAVIILSCGMVAHSDPVPRDGTSARARGPVLRKHHGAPAVPQRPGALTKFLSQRSQLP